MVGGGGGDVGKCDDDRRIIDINISSPLAIDIERVILLLCRGRYVPRPSLGKPFIITRFGTVQQFHGFTFIEATR